MVETGRNNYSVHTQSREAGHDDKRPVSLRDDTRILLKLKESLDQIEYGPNYDVAAERRAWQRFALAGRQTVAESQSETDEDRDENIPENTLQPAARHAAEPNKKPVSTAADRNSRAAHFSDGIRHDTKDKTNKQESVHCSKHILGAGAASSSHQRDLKIRLCIAS